MIEQGGPGVWQEGDLCRRNLSLSPRLEAAESHLDLLKKGPGTGPGS